MRWVRGRAQRLRWRLALGCGLVLLAAGCSEVAEPDSTSDTATGVDSAPTEPVGSTVSNGTQQPSSLADRNLVGEWVFESTIGAQVQATLTISPGGLWQWYDGCHVHGIPEHGIPDQPCDRLSPAAGTEALQLHRRVGAERDGATLTVHTEVGPVRFRSREIVPLDADGLGRDFVRGLGDGSASHSRYFDLPGLDASCPPVWSAHWLWRADARGSGNDGLLIGLAGLQQWSAQFEPDDVAELDAALERLEEMLAGCEADRDEWIEVAVPSLPDEVAVLSSVAALRVHQHTPEGEPSAEPRTRGTVFAVLRVDEVLTVLTGMFFDADQPPEEWSDAVDRVADQVLRTLSEDRERERALSEWLAEGEGSSR